MKLIQKLATAGAVAAIGLGLGASSASAFAISGNSGNPFNYTSNNSSTHRFTVAGAYTITCSGAVFSGTATGADNTNFTPAYTGCNFYGFPANVTQSGSWNIKVIGTSGSNYTGEIRIPSGSTTTIHVPITGCTVTISGAQGPFTHGSGGNVGLAANSGSNVNLQALVNGVAFTASGCPFSSGSSGVYNTGNAGTGSATPTVIPGINVS